MSESTDPNDWDEMWAWIDGEWRFVRKVDEVMGVELIVEDYELPGKLYAVHWNNCRRGAKPTTPPAPTGRPQT